MIGADRSTGTVWASGAADREVPFGGNSVQHGTAVFEGIRAYRSAAGPVTVFRLDDHVARLLGSADLLGIRHGFDHATLRRLVLRAADTVRGGSYLRPVVFAPEARLGVDLDALAFDCAVEVWSQPDSTAEHRGVAVTVSRWCRPSGKSFPRAAKVTGTYASSALARTEAARAGFDDAIQVDPDSGRVAEATVANVFGVRSGELFTPWLEDGPLAGITRDSVLRLATELGVPAVERPVAVDDLLTADELFLTGTATELVRVSRIGDRALPPDCPVLSRLAGAFDAAVTGRAFTHLDWLTPVPVPATTC